MNAKEPHFHIFFFFFNLPNLSSCTIAVGFIHPLTDMSIRSSWGKVQSALKADNLAAICEPTV
jgi:hypothetical protein